MIEKAWLAAKRALEGEASRWGADLDDFEYDATAGIITVFLNETVLPSRCERFVQRACPRLETMGHEPETEDCEYWAWEGMAAAAPGIELYPEWQRFDCHKYYRLFQTHLVTVKMAEDLGIDWRLLVCGTGDKLESLVKVYAGLSAAPKKIIWRPCKLNFFED